MVISSSGKGDDDDSLNCVHIANTSWTTAYSDACEKLGTTLGMTNMLAQERNTTNIVIYLINPSTQLSSNLALSRAFRTLVSAYTAVYRRFGRATIHPRALAMQIIPAEHVLRMGESFTMPVFKDIAFSVYSQCHSTLQRTVSKITKHPFSKLTRITLEESG